MDFSYRSKRMNANRGYESHKGQNFLIIVSIKLSTLHQSLDGIILILINR